MNENTPPSDHMRINIPSHPKYLQLIRGVIEKMAVFAGFAEEDAGIIVLAVDEACSNIIKHSYMNDPGGEIDVAVEIRKTELEIIIADYGNQCDLDMMQPRDLDDIRPGGLGIHIMNAVMDSVTYDCSSKIRNQVKMTKLLKPVR